MAGEELNELKIKSKDNENRSGNVLWRRRIYRRCHELA